MPSFEQTLLGAILDEAHARALGPVLEASGQLAAAMETLLISDTHGAVHIPHYWAVYVHDGRGPATRGRGSGKPPWVWFKNPAIDPRLDMGSTPARVKDLRHLTPEQFHYHRERGNLVVANRLGRIPGKFFFSNEPPEGGMVGFVLQAEKIGHDLFRRFALEELGDLLDLRDTLTFRL